MVGHKYYAELISGRREPISEAVANILLMFHGWQQVMAYPEFTIIKKR